MSIQETLSKITTLLKQEKSDAKDLDESPDAIDNAETADQTTPADTQHGTEYSFIYYVASFGTTLM